MSSTIWTSMAGYSSFVAFIDLIPIHDLHDDLCDYMCNCDRQICTYHMCISCIIVPRCIAPASISKLERTISRLID